jgi:hypothetical protein
MITNPAMTVLMPGSVSQWNRIYFPGDFGVRSEVNMFWGEKGSVVTPSRPQVELITAD